MDKAINLESVFQIINTQNEEIINSFIKIGDNSFNYRKQKGMSRTELNDLGSLASELIPKLETSQKNGYFLGYVVSAGLREEFDVLRYSQEIILNIELKHDLPSGGFEDIRDQLVRHQYLLSILKKKVVACTFLSKENKVYLLNDKSDLEEISLEDLASLIPTDYSLQNELSTVNLSKIIISPYSQPVEFAEHKYILTDEQKKISKEIFNCNHKKIAIIGGPGTGKSLLLMDLAKKYKDSGKKVIVLFCGLLDESDDITKAIEIEVIPISDWNNVEINEFDVILVDESQRIYKKQYEKLLELQDKLVIFSADHQQTLHQNEKNLNIEDNLKTNELVLVKELKNKVRTDAAMASFILKFLDLRVKKVQPYDYDKVNLVYFSDQRLAKEYIADMCYLEKYVSIEPTEYITKQTRVKKREYKYYNSKSVHSVVGREYDNVLIPLDKYFTYSDEGKLISVYNGYYPYDENSCIFEALTRVKNKLMLVVINNPSLYVKIQEILSWKNDKLYS